MNKQPFTLEKYPFVHSIQTRWMDNDVYGHVNNVIYYSFFDAAVGVFLTSKAPVAGVGKFDPQTRRPPEGFCLLLAPALGIRSDRLAIYLGDERNLMLARISR